MADWGFYPVVTTFGEDDTAGTSYKTSVTAGTGAKGTWKQVIASAASDISALGFIGQGSSGLGGFLWDIGIGGAGSEVVIVPNIAMGKTTTAGGFVLCNSVQWFPVDVPAGTRVAVRAAAPSGINTALNVKILTASFNSARPLHCATDYGSDVTNARGTVLTAGTANVKGSYAQITASTTQDMRWAVLYFGGVSTSTPADYAVDVAIGAGGSEQIIIPDIYVAWINGYKQNPESMMMPLAIPSGTRIAARCCATTSSIQMTFSLVGFL